MRTILIAEDNEDLRVMLGQYLGANGYRTVGAADGGKPRQITNFTSDRIFWFDFSHDGRQIALSRGTQTGDVVLIKDFR